MLTERHEGSLFVVWPPHVFPGIRGKLALCLRPSVFRPCTPLVFVQSHVSATARNLKAASGREVFHCTCLLLTQSGHEQVRFCRDTRPALRPATLAKETLGAGVVGGEAARISDSFGWAHDVAFWGAR